MITITWPTSVINVPKNDLLLIQSSPTEIRQLDLNEFRLALKSLEDDPEGMTWLKTHNHNPPVSVGGVTLSRVIEILPPYTVTFEDGQYAVNLVGANSNVGDRVNVNQVSVRSANSAGLVTSAAIEFGEYGGAVTVDVVSGVSGTIYPKGTLRMPVNNFVDAHIIADSRGFNQINIVKSSTIGSGADLTGKLVKGLSHIYTEIIIEEAASVANCTFTDCILSGTLDGNNNVENCIVGNVTYLNGHIHNSALAGTIVLGGNADANIVNCSQLNVSTAIPIIDMGGSGQDLIVADYTGNIKLKNLTGNNVVFIGLASGIVILDSTITSGTIQVNGVGELQDHLGNFIPSGMWKGTVTIKNYLMNQDTMAYAVWDEQTSSHTATGSFGEFIQKKLLTVAKFIGLK